MVLRTSPFKESSAFFSQFNYRPPAETQFITNHQKWQIRCQLDTAAGAIIFHVMDPHGMFHAVTEFIVEGVSAELSQQLNQCKTPQERQELLQRYLQERLDRASPYQIHIERFGNKLAIRFGDYGLKGGGRKEAGFTSACQVVAGIALFIFGDNTAKLSAGVLISTGLSGGLYALKPGGKEFNEEEYQSNAAWGGASGMISGGIPWATGKILWAGTGITGALGIDIGAKISVASGMIGGRITGVLGTNAMLHLGNVARFALQCAGKCVNKGAGNFIVSGLYETQRSIKMKVPASFKEMWKSACSGALGEGVGTIVGALLGLGFNNSDLLIVLGEKVNFKAIDSLKKTIFSENRIAGRAFNIVFIEENAWGIGFKAFVKTSLEGGLSAIGSKCVTNWVEGEKELSNGVRESGIVGAALGGVLGTGEAVKQFRQEVEAKNLLAQLLQAQKDLERTQSEKTVTENTVKNLEDTLRQSEQKLTEANDNLSKLEQSLDEKQKLDQVNKDRLDQAQQKYNQAKAAFDQGRQELTAAEQARTKAEKKGKASLKMLKNEIEQLLKQGFKAIVDGATTKDKDKILNKLIEKKEIDLKKGKHTKTTLKLDDKRAKEIRKRRDKEATARKLADDKHNALQQRQMEVAKTEDSLKLHQQEVQQAEQGIQTTKNTIETQKQTADNINAQLPAAKEKLIQLVTVEKNLADQKTAYDSDHKEALKRFQSEPPMRTTLYQHHDAKWILKDTIKPAAPVSYVQCGMDELISHVTLVHALCSDNGCRYYPEEFDWKRVEEEHYASLYTLQKLITSDGTIGHHLQLEKRELAGSFVSRPQMHWAWNQLVQPNSGAPLGGWEDATIAILEPLASFENSRFKPFTVAPYDTQTFGSVCLSEKSTILVPSAILTEVKAHLKNFKGKVVSYDADGKKLRPTIIGALDVEYPKTWHVCNDKGELIGHIDHKTVTGFESKTCLKTTDRKVHILLNGEGIKTEQRVHQGMKEYHEKGKRGIGLHIHTVTYWLEEKPYFIILQKIKDGKKELIKKCPLFFAGNIKEIRPISLDEILQTLSVYQSFLKTSYARSTCYTLGALEAFDFYEKMIQGSSPQTGCDLVAHYVLQEAIFADIESLFSQAHPEAVFDITVPELQLIISPIFPKLKRLLKQIKKQADESNLQRAFELFTQYRSLLQDCISNLQQAKKETVEALKRVESHQDTGKMEAAFRVAQEAWDKVKVPTSIEFNLGNNWPLSDELQAYVDKVIALLPNEVDQLQQLYHYLSSLACQEPKSNDVKKEQYRLNVLSAFVKYFLQVKSYLKLRKMDNNHSLLVPALARYQVWLQEQHLEVRDRTQQLGDCLFDNIISQARDIFFKTANTLRKEVIDYMRAHSATYESKPDYHDQNFLEVGDGTEELLFNDWKSYLDCLAKPQVWATELEISALSNMLKRPIVLSSIGAKPKIYNPEGTGTPIFLNHKNWNHYESCIPTESYAPREIYAKVLQEPHY